MGLMTSWVESANSADTPFPLNNLPYGVFSTKGTAPRCGVAIGDMILDLPAAEKVANIDMGQAGVFDHNWNRFMELQHGAWVALRDTLQHILSDREMPEMIAALTDCLVPQSKARMHMPFKVAEYTDFYAGKLHATNVGTMFRGAENALPANWLHIPIGYNGRASSVVVSGTDITRPNGQIKGPDADTPSFGPSQRLDIELELGAIVGVPSQMGKPISTHAADSMIFGYVLLNDWSARDIQAWEYQPLGPFQAKAFATSISPWIVTTAALEPFRTSTPEREKPLLPYLEEPFDMLFDIALSVSMKAQGGKRTKIAQTNADQLYYSAPQQLAHHASSGCPMSVGDLLGSGTISGPTKSERGSLLELTWGGAEPITLDSGETRTFLADGDTVTLQGAAHGDGYQVGFGTCTGTIKPAIKFP